MTARSWLLVAGDREEQLMHGLASQTDALILDLEDAVAPHAKGRARETVAIFLSETSAPAMERWVRINALNTPEWLADVEIAVQFGASGIVLPKASEREVDQLSNRLDAFEDRHQQQRGATRLIPIVTETAQGVLALHSFAPHTRRLAGLMWGAADLALEIGASRTRDNARRLTPTFELARSLTLMAAAKLGVPAIETAFAAIDDLEGLASFATSAREDGFAGMLAVHPDQVHAINSAFIPSNEDIGRASAVMAAFEASDGGSVIFGGTMFYAPHLEQARRLLGRRKV